MNRNFVDMRNGVVLAELGGYGDGPYCALHGAGAAMVLLGTYIVDAGDNAPYPKPFVFKPGRHNYANYLREHVAAARDGGGQVGVSVVSVEMEDTLDFLRAAEDAGADYASYCAHSVMDMFVGKGLSSMLCRRKNWPNLKKWAKAVASAVSIPVIFKIGAVDAEETAGAVDVVVDAGVAVIHANVNDTRPGSPGLDMLAMLRDRCSFLIGGGGVKDAKGARRVLAAGAQAAAIGTAAMKDPGLIARIQATIRA